VLSEDGRHADAIPLFNRAIEFGDEARFYSARGMALWRLQRLEAALRDYERAAALMPQDPTIMIERATLLGILKRADARTEADVAAVERLDPANDDLEWYRALPLREIVDRGTTLLNAGRIDEAIAEYTRAHEMGPGKSDALSARAAAWVKKEDHDRALQDLFEDIRLDPKRFISYQRIDWILAKRGEWDRIIGHWDAYIGLVPGDARAHMERGGAWSRKGDRAKALFDARKACDLGDEKGCEIVKRNG
jgi:tetratricopeptide (TPR) repeat protein